MRGSGIFERITVSVCKPASRRRVRRGIRAVLVASLVLGILESSTLASMPPRAIVSVLGGTTGLIVEAPPDSRMGLVLDATDVCGSESAVLFGTRRAKVTRGVTKALDRIVEVGEQVTFECNATCPAGCLASYHALVVGLPSALSTQLLALTDDAKLTAKDLRTLGRGIDRLADRLAKLSVNLAAQKSEIVAAGQQNLAMELEAATASLDLWVDRMRDEAGLLVQIGASIVKVQRALKSPSKRSSAVAIARGHEAMYALAAMVRPPPLVQLSVSPAIAGLQGADDCLSGYDACGVCGGDDQSCAGCDGVANSGIEWGVDCDTGEPLCGGPQPADCPTPVAAAVAASVVGGAIGGSLVALASLAGIFIAAGIVRRSHWQEQIAGAYDEALEEQLTTMQQNPLHDSVSVTLFSLDLDDLVLPGAVTTTTTSTTTTTTTTTTSTTTPPPMVCGNGTRDSGEQCDPTAPNAGSGCLGNCTCDGVNPCCGDGVKHPNEACDPTSQIAGPGCLANCTCDIFSVCNFF